MGYLTTHVLDTVHGGPGAGMKVEVYALDGGRRLLKGTATNAAGRTDQPLIEGAAFVAGTYELVFAVAEYFRMKGVKLPEPPFLDHVAICFGVADPTAHYHVPLLASPFSYTTYRGG
ncbi:MAG: hydroxyisourate hydrolase [Proteobacteria bacterium]|nr:hydroxyisourate hydrolase [Pseudomonadota bacterium]